MAMSMQTDTYKGFLEHFNETALFRFFARLLIFTQIFLGLPAPAVAATPSDSPSSAAVTELAVTGTYQLIGSKRVSSTLIDFTYRAEITNSGTETFPDVAATVVSQAASTMIVDGAVFFGEVTGGATLFSQDTFTIRQNRTVPFNPNDLVWTVQANRAPAANAGAGQTMAVGGTVTLDGSGSSDPDGDDLTYAWSFVAVPPGSTAQLSDAAAIKPTFVIDRPGDYTLQLVVDDGKASSLPAQVTISTLNTPPVAVARLNQAVRVGQTAQLDGSASSDVDGDPLTFRWTLTSQPAGSTAILSDSATVTPTLPIDKAGQYTVELIVNDGTEDSTPTPLIISTENTPPVAHAGSDRKIALQAEVVLDGSASMDIDGDTLSFLWSLIGKPANSTASLSDPSLVKPKFTADLPGDYVAQLIVNDGKANSAPASVILTTENTKPVANAGTPQTVPLQTTVTLDGSLSSDAENDPLTYLWSLTSIPFGSAATLSDPGAQQPQFLVDLPGSYIAQLIVNDGHLASDPANVIISTENSRPVANAGPDQEVKAGDAVQLDGGASGDADHHPLTYQWSFTAKPQDSTATLSDPASATPTFVADRTGAYVLQLIVNDGQLNSEADTVTIEAKPVMVTVPNVVGETQAAAEATLITAQLTVGAITAQASDTVPAGTVISQAPVAGTEVEKASAVTLVVSTGPALVSVPNLVGQTQAAAAAAISAAQLTLGAVTPASSDTVPAGQVISQNPLAGASVAKGSAVNLVVSSGPALVTVPNVVGQTQAAATAAITSVGLSVGIVTQQSSDTILAGSVVSQTPVGGTSVAAGTPVDLIVSTGAAPVVLSQLTVTPPSPTILVGQTQPFSAIGTNSDGTGQDMTGQVTWDSSNPSVATITADGVVTALTEGSTTIRASQGAIAGTTLLTVSATVSDTTLPTAVLTAPAADSTVTEPTEVKGTASDANFLKYVLDYAPAGETHFTVLATGTTPVVNGTLGTFDPTLLLNDLYTLRLTTYDKGGNTAQVSVQVQVGRDQKVGNFSLAFQDLNIPVAGIPITITRVYDSRDKTSGDFGFGWRLDLQTLRLRVNREQGSGWQVNKSGGFFPTYTLVPNQSHVVSITLPDGKVEQFDLSTEPSSQLLFPLDFVTPVYKARPGTLGKLRPLSGGIFVSGSQPGAVTLLDDGDFFTVYNPTTFEYSTPEGRVFIINKDSGVQKVSDANGNSLTIGTTGIMHSSGKGITFTRDSQGRITKITDPNGNVIQYAYDVQGDLITHTDPEGNSTRFKYNFSHGLLEIRDPRGNVPARNEYDAEGRLIATIDTKGNRVELIHDVAGQREIRRDRNGNVTVSTYDDKGNLTSETDPLGNTTTHTYDDRGNELSITDPLGNRKTFTYDQNNNRTSETDAGGNVTTYTYNTRNQLLTITDPLGRKTVNNYDAKGNLISTVDPAGNTTSHTYDARGNRTSTQDAEGNLFKYEYDASGNRTKYIDAAGNITTYQYDVNGNKTSESSSRTDTNGNVVVVTTSMLYDKRNKPIEQIDALGNSVRFTYNSLGKEETFTDKNGNRLTRYYDDIGNLIQTTYADGTFEAYTYDAENNRIGSTDRAGRITSYEYDGNNRLVRTQFPDGTSETRSYNAIDKVGSITDQNGHTTRYDYDAVGRKISVTNALGHVTRYAYDAKGNQVSMTDATGNITRFEYDLNDRKTKTVFPDGTFKVFAYDTLGRKISESDQAGNITQFAYDAQGRLIRVTDALGGVTQYAYDEVGNRTAQIDANGHQTTWTYDGLGRILSRTLPLGMTETFTYDANGNISTHTDFKGQTISYSYDSNNQLILKTLPNGSQITYSYTPTGKVTTIVDDHGVTTFEYDLRDMPVKVVNADGTILEYQYDAKGNRTSVTLPSGTINHEFDAINRLIAVTDTQGRVTRYSYDNVGNRTRIEYPNGSKANYGYDALNRLTSLSHVTSDGSVLAGFEYILDAVGNRTAATEEGGVRTDYSYDKLYRLTQEQITESGIVRKVVSYTYDGVGNRLSKTTDGEVINYVYDDNDRMISEGVVTYSYDANGNLIERSNGGSASQFEFDYENRMVKATEPGNVTEYIYDDDGVRIGTVRNGVTSSYLVDKNRELPEVLEERDSANGLIVVYIHGDDLISQQRGTEIRFYHYDGLGSTRLLTDFGAGITDRYAYDAFGNLLNSSGITDNRYLFTGEEFDPETAFYYLRARYYDPGVGRFTSMDSFQGNIYDPKSLHKYVYANGDPVNLVDPSGHFAGVAMAMPSISISISINTAAIASAALLLAKVTLAVAGAAVAACALNAALSFSTAIGSGGACDVSKFNIFYSGMDTPFTTAHIASAIATGAPASPLRRISPPHSRAWLRSDPRCSGNVASQTLLWCDEYPFASTDRGGQANGPSLMLVPAVEQMYQGGMLSAFYFACNVVANDPLNGVFGVVPGTPTTSWQCK